MPALTAALETHRTVRFERMRSGTVGRERDGMREVVVVGMAVADYIMPGVAALGAWTRAHVVGLPGLAGSGEPPPELSVDEHGEALALWRDDAALDGVVLVGHSSGTQVAARAALHRQRTVAALVLASPTIDPAARCGCACSFAGAWTEGASPRV
jgi:pimeloyl-ACP methyl ester carboxylesterase